MSIADQILELEDELEKFRSEEKYTDMQLQIADQTEKIEELEDDIRDLRKEIDRFIEAVKYI